MTVYFFSRNCRKSAFDFALVVVVEEAPSVLGVEDDVGLLVVVVGFDVWIALGTSEN